MTKINIFLINEYFYGELKNFEKSNLLAFTPIRFTFMISAVIFHLFKNKCLYNKFATPFPTYDSIILLDK